LQIAYFFLLLRGFFLCEVEFGREGFDPGGPTNFPDFPESVLSHHWELHFEPRTLHLPAMGAVEIAQRLQSQGRTA